MDFTLSAGNKMELLGQVHRPDGKVDKVIVLLHGVGDHFGRFSEWASRFTKKGVAVAGVDLPGHGKSPGKRGHIKSYHIYNEIIDSLYRFVKNEFGDIPTGLYGQSLGGNIALNYLISNRADFDFSVITSPWIKLTDEPPKAKVAMARLVNHILPGLLQPNGLVLEHISGSGKIREGYKSDPLVHDRISIRLAVEALNAADRIILYRDKIKLPVLLLHGEDDKITSPGGSNLFANGKANATLKIWENGYHELQNEPFNDKVFEFIYQWLIKL